MTLNTPLLKAIHYAFTHPRRPVWDSENEWIDLSSWQDRANGWALKDHHIAEYVQSSYCSGLLSVPRINLNGNSAIGKMTIEALASFNGLTHLSLSGCSITSNSSLDFLVELEYLLLNNCRNLDNLSFCSSLNGLKNLSLTGCLKIHDLIPISKLKHLESLSLMHCAQASDLKPLIDLRKLSYLALIGCIAVKNMPESQVNPEDPRTTLKNWQEWHAAQHGQIIGDRLNECRVFLVGEQEVGKTTLRKAIMKQPIPRYEHRTEGIEIHNQAINPPRQINGAIHPIHLWDFAGQHLQHSTHRCYLSERCLYILVIDATRSDIEGVSLTEDQRQIDHPEAGNRLTYWLRLIHHYGKDAPVIIVRSKLRLPDGEPLPADIPSAYSDEALINACERWGVNLISDGIVNADCPSTDSEFQPFNVHETLLPRLDMALSGAPGNTAKDDRGEPATRQLRLMTQSRWPAYRVRARDQIAERIVELGFTDYNRNRLEWEESLTIDERSDLSKFGYDWDHVVQTLRSLGELLYSDTTDLCSHIYQVEWANNLMYALIRLNKSGPFTINKIQQELNEASRSYGGRKFGKDDVVTALALMQQSELCLMVPDIGVDSKFVIPSLMGTVPQRELSRFAPDQVSTLPCGFDAASLVNKLTVRLSDRTRPEDCWSDAVYIYSKEDAAEALVWAAVLESENRPDALPECINIAFRGESDAVRMLRVEIGYEIRRQWEKYKLKPALPSNWQLDSEQRTLIKSSDLDTDIVGNDARKHPTKSGLVFYRDERGIAFVEYRGVSAELMLEEPARKLLVLFSNQQLGAELVHAISLDHFISMDMLYKAKEQLQKWLISSPFSQLLSIDLRRGISYTLIRK